jgi:hypothetical protein
MKTRPKILTLASVLAITPLLSQCTDRAPLQPDGLAPPQRLDNRIGPPEGRWLSDYLPLSPQRYGIRWYYWLDSDTWMLSRIEGTETIPYLSGDAQATILNLGGDGMGFVQSGNELWFLAARYGGGLGYWLSTDCSLSGFPADKIVGRVYDGMLLDMSGPAFYVRNDLGPCVPVDGFGGGNSGLMLVKESDVDLFGQRYNNAIVLWDVEPGVPFKDVFFWGIPGDPFGIRLPTAEETGGWAVDDFTVLALQNGIVATGDIRLTDGGLDDISVLLGTFRGASAPVHRLTGGGTIVWTDEVTVQYGFAATLDASGEAHGVLQFDYWEAGLKWHGAIDCLNVVGNRAWASGVFTGGTNAGQYFYFGVEDNGEGAGASGPDLISLIYYSSTPKDCHVNMPEPYQGWTNGNVQIRYLAGDLWYVEDDDPGM